MNCLLLSVDEFDAATNRARVVGRRRQHAEKILKSVPGDTLRVGLIGGRLGRAEVLRLDEESLDLSVEFDRDPPRKRPLTLVLALPRPPVFKRLLSTIASMGVARLLVVGTARTEKSFWQSHVLDPDEVRERLLVGLEQASDSVLPEFEVHRYFEPLVDDILPPLLKGSQGLVAHPAAERPCPSQLSEAVTLFVGPEGGLVDYELERLGSIGFEPVHLGERVVRVEPVIPMLIGRLFR